jgi:hypothetical protein
MRQMQQRPWQRLSQVVPLQVAWRRQWIHRKPLQQQLVVVVVVVVVLLLLLLLGQVGMMRTIRMCRLR